MDDIGSDFVLYIHLRFSLTRETYKKSCAILKNFDSCMIRFAVKDVHIVVLFAYLLALYSKFEWAENRAVQARIKKLNCKLICCTTKWFL